MLRVDQIKVSIDSDLEDVKNKMIKQLRISETEILSFNIHRKNIDARKKEIFMIYSVNVKLASEEKILRRHLKNVRRIQLEQYCLPTQGIIEMKHRPIIIGFGPAGMFCALMLARAGYRPIVFEQGGDVDQRKHDIDLFYRDRILNEESNIQFGEGGAGTFSDGKLTARSKDLRVHEVYENFVKYGAPEEILYEALPHVGSDKLETIVKCLREDILALGASIHFQTKVDSLDICDDRIRGVYANGEHYESDHVILALGNSARGSMIQWNEQGVAMEPKAFAVGLRIEHQQVEINKAAFHDYYDHPNLHQASYQLSHHSEDGGVYSFCMCPGGEVVAATSLMNHVVVNGMSSYARDKENANSAILVQVNQGDYGTELFDGMKFQDTLEQAAFQLGGANYNAPIQTLRDFLRNTMKDKVSDIVPSYRIGTTYANLNTILPERIARLLKEGIRSFQKKNSTFLNENAILTGVETRSSSPVRMLRNEGMESISVRHLYPIGEGSGYSGGIVSSAIDGIKCAEKIIELYKAKSKT